MHDEQQDSDHVKRPEQHPWSTGALRHFGCQVQGPDRKKRHAPPPIVARKELPIALKETAQDDHKRQSEHERPRESGCEHDNPGIGRHRCQPGEKEAYHETSQRGRNQGTPECQGRGKDEEWSHEQAGETTEGYSQTSAT